MKISSLLVLCGVMACSDPSGPATTFSAQFQLSAVADDQNVPFSPPGQGHKSIVNGCLVFSTDGSAVETLLYSRIPTAGAATIERETFNWSYALDGGDVMLTGTFLTAVETERIPIVADVDISIYQALQNEGLIVTRTLRFTKLGSGSAANCGL